MLASPQLPTRLHQGEAVPRDVRELYDQGLRYLAAGGNAMRLRTYLEQGTREILAELNRLTIHLEGEEAPGEMQGQTANLVCICCMQDAYFILGRMSN